MKGVIKFLIKKTGYVILHKQHYNSIISQAAEFKSKLSYLESQAHQYIPACDSTYPLRPEFQHPQFSMAALQKLLSDFDFNSVLDIGAGSLFHSRFFAEHGKEVTAVDYGKSIYYEQRILENGHKIKKIIGDFNDIVFNEQYDCVWASHILEHQLNVSSFLSRLVSLVREEGVIAITVPPLKHAVVGGHVSLWNAGLVLYRLVLAGLDCSQASVLSYGYNISVIVKKTTITIPTNLEYDCGDIRRLKQYFPKSLQFDSNEQDDPFNGNISRLNW